MNNNGWNGGQPNPNGYGMYNQGGYAPMTTTVPAPVQVAQPPRIQMPQQAPPHPMQPPMQQMPMGVPGRWVNDFNEIKPGEVPMDGTICFFPKADYSCIYAKVWDQNGKLQDFVFVPEISVKAEPLPEQSNKQLDMVMEKLDAIEKQVSQITQINKSYHPKPNKKPYHPKSNRDKEDKT